MIMRANCRARQVEGYGCDSPRNSLRNSLRSRSRSTTAVDPDGAEKGFDPSHIGPGVDDDAWTRLDEHDAGHTELGAVRIHDREAAAAPAARKFLGKVAVHGIPELATVEFPTRREGMIADRGVGRQWSEVGMRQPRERCNERR